MSLINSTCQHKSSDKLLSNAKAVSDQCVTDNTYFYPLNSAAQPTKTSLLSTDSFRCFKLIFLFIFPQVCISADKAEYTFLASSTCKAVVNAR